MKFNNKYRKAIKLPKYKGARRIRNCSPNLPWMTAAGFLNRLMISMMWGGYPERTRRIVADRILARHNNNMQNLQEHGRKLYRSKEDRANMERTDKATWFRKAGATATLFVPTTPGSQLAKGIREVLQKHPGPIGTTTKVVERPGMSIHSNISPNNPFPRQDCGRRQCPYLRARKPCLENCAKENITYRAECLKCEENQRAEGVQVIKRVYFGESSRTLHHRTGQHLNDFSKAIRKEGRRSSEADQESSSWISDHAKEAHGGVQGIDPDKDIKFIKISSHRDPLSRQVEEATLITWGLEKGLDISTKNEPEVVVSLNRK